MNKVTAVMMWVLNLLAPLGLVLFMVLFMLMAWAVEGLVWIGSFALSLHLRFMGNYRG